jgi:aspartokinase-like uncharacterized kinase
MSKRTFPSATVIKVGGSLFDLPDLIPRLDRLIGELAAPVILLAGGGGLADEIRRLEAIHGWSAGDSHRLALQAMSVTARILAALSPQYDCVTTAAELARSCEHGRVPVLDASNMPAVRSLPESWAVTSDSIAVCIAIDLRAARLLLAKSTDLSRPFPSAQEAADLGLVDAYFPRISSSVEKTGWINLRTEIPRLQWWIDGSQSHRDV